MWTRSSSRWQWHGIVVPLPRYIHEYVDERQANADERELLEQEGPVFCKYCQKWLNGSTQWADHEVGKNHHKAVQMTHAHKKEEGSKPFILWQVDKRRRTGSGFSPEQHRAR
jgi:hypothetical protein